jgi:hypothetical protein
MVSLMLLDKSMISIHAIQGSVARFHFSIMLLTCFIRSGLYGYETQRLTFFFTFFFFLSVLPSFLNSIYIYFLRFLPFVLFLLILSYFLSWGHLTSVCIYIHIYTHIYIYIYRYLYIHIYLCTYVFTPSVRSSVRLNALVSLCMVVIYN